MNTKEFKEKINEKLNDEIQKKNLTKFYEDYPKARQKAFEGYDFEQLRNSVKNIKQNTVDKLEELADKFQKAVEKNGAVFYRAVSDKDVVDYILKLCKEKDVKLVVKSKSMLSEEVELAQHFKEAGIESQETDLGEWIIQIAKHKPSHMVMPAIHLNRQQVADYFEKQLGKNMKPDIEFLVHTARAELREKFLKADLGISGCNIAVAENGAMFILTNEGNGRLTSSLPKTHIVLVGYEKLVESFEDAIPILRILPRNATAQTLTSYVNIILGPSQAIVEHTDGTFSIEKKELHVILVDHGRIEMARDPIFKELYQCIRCSACTNVCPVYALVGGHVFGNIYTGGIGALLNAFIGSSQTANQIQNLCITCGSCTQVCSGSIDIPNLIIEMRKKNIEKEGLPTIPKVVFQNIMSNRSLFHNMLKLARLGQKSFKNGQFIRNLPLYFSKYTKDRSLPAIADVPFRDIFDTILQKPAKNQEKIAFFSGCLIDFVYPETGEAVVKSLNALGFSVEFPKDQTCCGTPMYLTGDKESAKKVAMQNLEALESIDPDYIVIACPTGVEMWEKYPQFFKDDPKYLQLAQKYKNRIREYSSFVDEQLNKQNIKLNSLKNNGIATYHDSCHLKRVLGIHTQPRDIIAKAFNTNFVEMEHADQCCGMAGSYSLKFPEISKELGDQKHKSIIKSTANLVYVGCPACMLQIKGLIDKKGGNVKVMHIAQLVNEALKENK
ncbi:MAG: L-lactate dehydrogenase (quinone) large subunit LdhH [Desulfurella sp.]|uniref:L-lactate dehydrogenase (quinone) large subunit LdhH n=1 Tax=Desulfurella sp. TaxID=1962857 RepID=UPI001768DCAD|nr:4Fe-4S dicluster domain-containing protein [Desulfurella acetivorans]